jgi:hypothetical protein
MVERINSHFGYRAVARLRILQGPVPERVTPKKRPGGPVTPETETKIAARVDGIRDPDLKAALQALGREIARQPK